MNEFLKTTYKILQAFGIACGIFWIFVFTVSDIVLPKFDFFVDEENLVIYRLNKVSGVVHMLYPKEKKEWIRLSADEKK